MLKEPADKLDEEILRICLPLSLFLACFRLGHYNEMGGHMGAANPITMQNDSTTGLVCLTGYLHLILIV